MVGKQNNEYIFLNEINHLSHDSDLLSKVVNVDLRDVMTANVDGSALRLVQLHEESSQ